MSKNVWLGGIFLKDEGGYEVIFRALEHYQKRLKSIGQSPELCDSPMFVMVVRQEAAKTIPQIDSLIGMIKEALKDNSVLQKLESEIPFLEKALTCYHSDIQKAMDNAHPYYTKLVSDIAKAKSDFEILPNAIKKIKNNQG